MNSRIKVKLEDGTIATVSKFVAGDKEFDKESQAVEFLRDKALQDIREWFEDNSCIDQYRRDEIINGFKAAEHVKIAKLAILLSDLLV